MQNLQPHDKAALSTDSVDNFVDKVIKPSQIALNNWPPYKLIIF